METIKTPGYEISTSYVVLFGAALTLQSDAVFQSALAAVTAACARPIPVGCIRPWIS